MKAKCIHAFQSHKNRIRNVPCVVAHTVLEVELEGLTQVQVQLALHSMFQVSLGYR